jgi:hypothetical protein
MTIKLNDGKVVLKDGRASCSCCAEPACCMYAADGAYDADDLPEAVTVLNVGTMNKSGFGYAGGGYELRAPDGLWILSGPQSRAVGKCLIRGDGNLTQGDDLVEDQFADEYNVQIAGADDFLLNATVTRNELCEWTYFDQNTFTGVSLVFFDSIQKWGVEGISGEELVDWAANGLKGNPQNNPVGTYEVTFAFNLGTGGQFSTAGVTITVT